MHPGAAGEPDRQRQQTEQGNDEERAHKADIGRGIGLVMAKGPFILVARCIAAVAVLLSPDPTVANRERA